MPVPDEQEEELQDEIEEVRSRPNRDERKT